VRKLRAKIQESRAKAGALVEDLAEIDAKLAKIEGIERRRRERGPDAPEEPSLARVSQQLNRLLDILQAADVAPTPRTATATSTTAEQLRVILDKLGDLRTKDVKALNERLRKAKLPTIDE
jgi:hypothetical protein